MLSATHIKDMNAEELFSIIAPFFYLVPVILVIILAVSVYKLSRRLAVKRMLAYMEREGLSQEEKRSFLTGYLTYATGSDLRKGVRRCPVCAKQYALKTQKTNSRGDVVEEWNYGGCTFCNTKVYEENEVNQKGYLAIKRTKTCSPDEEKWQSTFNKLNHYINYYKPYIDKTPDSSGGGDITINITIGR